MEGSDSGDQYKNKYSRDGLDGTARCSSEGNEEPEDPLLDSLLLRLTSALRLLNSNEDDPLRGKDLRLWFHVLK